MKNWYSIFCFLLVFSFGNNAFAQSKIDYDSDRFLKNEEKYPGASILKKVKNQVVFTHEGIKVWCDLAIFYQQENFFKAFGNVRMMQGDTITMNSGYAEYNGNTKFAFASEKVELQTPNNTLTTDTLFFNRKKQQAYYRSGGVLKDSASTITSKIGRYYMEDEKYSFVSDVVVINPEYHINTEQLDFYNETGHAYLYGPSTIKSEDNTIYCERGFYDTRGDTGYFVKNSTIHYKNRKLQGDSIFFDRDSGFASATNHIKVTDTANNTLITGHYAQVYKKKDSVFITKRALISTLQGKDSIFVHSDTIMVTGKPENRVVRGFYEVRMFSETMSGKCDSIYINEKNGITKMLGNPVVWSGAGQITGDTIHLLNDVKTDKLDSLRVFENAFIVQKDSIEGFNQVKGKRMYGLFKENELYEVNLIQNTETIYYLRNSESELIGIDKTLASSIKILLKNREVKDIFYYTNVDGTTYPDEDLPKNARRLRGFNWRGDERLHSKKDLFLNDPPLNLPQIKGIELPEAKKSFFDNGEEEKMLLNEKSRLSPKNLQPQKMDSVEREDDNLKKAPQYLAIPDSKIDSLGTNMVQDSLPKATPSN
ncbi:MAG TPA: OstA-like protein [Flavobacteriaceae bacterium]|nr:OstA-like protein [Flavobacteriaceae bacterium]